MMMMKAVRTSETSVDNYFTRQYIPEDNSVHHTRRRENLKSHMLGPQFVISDCFENVMSSGDFRGGEDVDLNVDVGPLVLAGASSAAYT
jgi:hypothetical protein